MRMVGHVSKAFFHFVGRNAEAIIALASMVVAVAALWFSVTEARKSAAIERLRWLPKIAFTYSRDEDYSISVRNEGLGPSYVQWVQVYWDDQRLGSWKELYARTAAESEVPLNIDTSYRRESFIHQSIVHSSGPRSEVSLISEQNPQWKEVLWSNRNRVDVVVCHCSLLWECSLQIGGDDRDYFEAHIRKQLPTCEPNKEYPMYFFLSSED